jgi:hypothetical protein
MNKLIKVTLASALMLLGALASSSALAWHRGGAHVGVFIGGPVWGYPYYPYPYYAYPPVVVQAPPTQYIEQSSPDTTQQQGYWYYCADAKAYYPYVKDCPAGWQKVVPQTQPPASR